MGLRGPKARAQDKAPEVLYALFHVNRNTQEAFRYPRESFPAGNKEVMEAKALDSRIGKTLGSYTQDEWTTQALPEIES